MTADAGEYFRYGYNLRNHHTYSMAGSSSLNPRAPIPPDAVRTPGYPLLLSLFEKAPLDDWVLPHILLFQAFLSALTVVLVFCFSRIFLPAGWAVAASLLTAISPHLIAGNSYILTETFFGFLLMLFALLVSLPTEKRSIWLDGTAGLILGFASLVRPGLQYFPVAMAPLFIEANKWKKGIRTLFPVILGFFIVFSPWIIRNIVVLGKASDSGLMINFLHHGMYPNFTFEGKPESYGYPYRFDPRSKEIAASVGSVLKEIGRRFYEEPLRHLKWYLIGKPVALWSWNTVQGIGDVFIYRILDTPYVHNPLFILTHTLMYFLHWPLVCLGLMASVLVWVPGVSKRLARERLLAARVGSLVLLYFTAIHMIGAPFPRYSFPLLPVLFTMASLMMHILVRLVCELRSSRAAFLPTQSQELNLTKDEA